MKKTFYPGIRDELIEIDHKSGLKVFIMPKPGHKKTYAVFATNYGSIDRTFKSERTGEFTTVPDGIAHFLEHKLFEGEEGSAFEKYAKTGASANAYTSFDKTAYLFSCTSQFEENLEILLSFVQKPYFTDENVQKEQGIIGQEIRMYDDNASVRVLMNLLEAVYANHPVRVDIAGTVESIAEINKDILNICYETFYSLSNMVLCVSGDVEADSVIRILDKTLLEKAAVSVTRDDINEPLDVVKDYVEQSLEVSIPKFYLGFKDNSGVFLGKEAQRIDFVTLILLEMIAGKTTKLYGDLFDKGLINKNFMGDSLRGRSFGVSIFGGESPDPRAVRSAINNRIKELMSDFDEEEFETAKKIIYSRTVLEFNSTDDIANNMVSCYFNNTNIFEGIDILKTISIEEAKIRLFDHFKEKYSVLSVIQPRNQEKI